MLLIKTFHKETKKKGIGLFAAEPILKGTIIWEYDPNFDKKFTETEFESFSKDKQDFLIFYASHEHDYCWHLSVDNDRFINHSDIPNVTYEFEYGQSLRDIEEGEEILADYRLFDIDCLKDLGFKNKEKIKK